MKIHESGIEAGFFTVHLVLSEHGLDVVTDQPRVLPKGALDAVMARYGAELEPSARITKVDALYLDEGSTLHHVRHLARYDVIAKDFLVYERPGEAALCALANTVSAALVYLSKRAT